VFSGTIAVLLNCVIVGMDIIVSVGVVVGITSSVEVDENANDGNVTTNGVAEPKDEAVGVGEDDSASASGVTVVWVLRSPGNLQPVSNRTDSTMSNKTCFMGWLFMAFSFQREANLYAFYYQFIPDKLPKQ